MAAPHRPHRRLLGRRQRRRLAPVWLWLAAALFLALVLAPAGVAAQNKDKGIDEPKQRKGQSSDPLEEQYEAMEAAAKQQQQQQVESDEKDKGGKGNGGAGVEAPVVTSSSGRHPDAVSHGGETTVAVGFGKEEDAVDEEEDWELEDADDTDVEDEDEDTDVEDEDEGEDTDVKDEEDEPKAAKVKDSKAKAKDAVMDSESDKAEEHSKSVEKDEKAKPGRPLPPKKPEAASTSADSEDERVKEEEKKKEERAEVERYEAEHKSKGGGKGGKPWWAEEGVEGEGAVEGEDGHGPQPWQAACEGEWGYEGYANKTGRGGGHGNGPKAGFEDEAEFERRCARFNESVQYVEEFAAANPNATFTVGLNNMSDWTPEEQASLFGSKDPVFDPNRVLDMDDTATVEALITGQAAYEEVFGGGSGAGAATTEVTVIEGPGTGADVASVDPDAAKEAAFDAASTLIGHDDTSTATPAEQAPPSPPLVTGEKEELSMAAEPPAVELIPEAGRAPEILQEAAPEQPPQEQPPQEQPQPAAPVEVLEDAAPAPVVEGEAITAETDPAGSSSSPPAPPATTDPTTTIEADPTTLAGTAPLGVLVEKPADAEADAPYILSAESGAAFITPPVLEPEPEPEPTTTEGGGRRRDRRVLGRALPAGAGTSTANGGSFFLPSVIDYRYADFNPYKIVAVTPVKDQGKCGSCWAFTTAAMLEGQVALQRNGSTKNLSPQQLIDCNLDNKGCNGGRVNEALNYTQEMGIRTLGSYPYEGSQGTCRGPDPAFAYSAGPTFVAPCDERQLMKALYYFGPVAVNVKANCPAFMKYAAGIFTPDQDCVTQVNGAPPTQEQCAKEVDHAMLLVGYGTDSATGMDFWILKNTWSTTWGEGGYMRLQRNTGLATCGTSCINAFPVAAVQGFATTDASTWGDDDVIEEDNRSTGEKIIDAIKDAADKAAAALDEAGEAFKEVAKELKTLDVRILAVAIFFAVVFFLAFSYYCCCVRRWRRQRRIRLELERERARWV